MTALRRVCPRNACEPGSSAPSYASTSVSRTATSPCRSTAFRSRGATSRTGPTRTSRSSGEPGTVRVDEDGQLVELLADPVGRRTAAAVPRRDGALDREDLPDPGSECRGDLGELLVAQVGQVDAELLAAAYARTGDLVRDAERHALPDQPLGDVGGE